MGQLFHYDSPLVEFINKIVDLILLNVLFLLGSIPLVTIGASQVALYTALHQHFSSDKPIFSTFWKSYFANIKQSIILSLLSVSIHILGIGGIIYYSYSKVSPFLFILQCFIFLLWNGIDSWVFLLQAKFDNTIKNTIYNAFCCTISNTFKTLCAVILRSLWIILFLFMPSAFIYLLPFLFMIWFSLSSWLISKLYGDKISSMEKLAKKQEINCTSE